MSGARDAPEFMAHAHFQDWADGRRSGRRRKIAHVNTPSWVPPSCVFCSFLFAFSSFRFFRFGIQRRGFPDPIHMGGKSREAKQGCLRQIVHMCRAQGTESDWSAILGEAARALGVLPIPPPLPDLSGPGLYLDSFRQTSEFAVSPHGSRHPLAIGPGINSTTRAWE